MREFTWWRRFYPANQKLPKKYMYKGIPQLLQRIEFGEFEYCPLAHESYLEERIYLEKIREIEEKHKGNSDLIFSLSIHERKKFHKRRDLIMMNHIKLDNKIIGELVKALSKEFNMSPDDIMEAIENFDGTNRQFYFYLACITTGKEYSKEKVDAIPAYIPEQPRHIMKPKDKKKWSSLWRKTLADIEKGNICLT